jgi:hypothetical protein
VATHTRRLVRPSVVAAAVAIACTCVAARQYHVSGIAGSINVGRIYYNHGHSSPTIDRHAQPSRVPGYAGANGYDGEFYYFIALDPVHAHDYLINPAFTYSRIAYPMVARSLALGSADAIPYTLLIINILAISIATFLLSRWLDAHGVHPAFALAYGLFPGLVFAGTSDLTEPLAFTLAAAGSLAFLSPRRGATWFAAVLFATALLTRETTALFPLVFALYLAARGREALKASTGRRLTAAAAFVAIAFGPLMIYRAWLAHWLRGPTVESAFSSHIPFSGLWAHWSLEPGMVTFLIATVALPGLIWAGYAAKLIVRDTSDVIAWLILLNALAFVIFLPTGPYVDYRGAGRASIGLVLASVLALSRLRSRGLSYAGMVALCIPWLVPWLVPSAIGIRALW